MMDGIKMHPMGTENHCSDQDIWSRINHILQ